MHLLPRDARLPSPFSKSVRRIVVLTCAAAGLGFSSKTIHGEDPAVQSLELSNAAEVTFAPETTPPQDDPREAPTNAKVAFATPFGQLRWSEIADKITFQGRQATLNHRGHKLLLSLKPELQELLEKQLDAQKYISGAIVLIESGTGRILAMAERRGNVQNPLLTRDSIVVSARAPAASLMKIITAAAVIEKKSLSPDLEVPFHGGCGHLHGQNWLRDPGQDRQKLTFGLAFGKSCNTVFARLAIYDAGLSSLREMAERFYFNKPIPSDLLLDTSAAFLPSLESATTLEVGLAGAGFGASALSPVHSAMLSAAVGSGGVLMAPYLVDAAIDAQGREVYRATPRQLGRILSPQTASKMAELMQETVLAGTSRRYFRRKGTRDDMFNIGGKTGTLSDPEARQILYTWFSGIAPLDSTNGVAIGTLVASPQNWLVRASSLAQASLAAYLKMEKRESRVASAGSKQ